MREYKVILHFFNSQNNISIINKLNKILCLRRKKMISMTIYFIQEYISKIFQETTWSHKDLATLTYKINVKLLKIIKLMWVSIKTQFMTYSGSKMTSMLCLLVLTKLAQYSMLSINKLFKYLEIKIFLQTMLISAIKNQLNACLKFRN